MDMLATPLLPENYSASKSCAELVQDLSKTLCPDGLPLQTDCIPEYWTYYLEQNVEPAGWQGLWKASRETRKEVMQVFTGPTVVEVLNVDYTLREALVESLEDDDSMGKQCSVPLTELHPLRDQENPAIVIEKTHLALQKLRFFFEHLWFPWDLDDTSTDWISTHLETRVSLYCEIRSGLLPKEITTRYYNLISEAFQIHRELTLVEEQIQSRNLDNAEAERNEIFHVALLNEHLEKIQKDIELIYNPNTRMALFAVNTVKERFKEKPEVLFVINGQSMEQLKTIITSMESFVKEETIRSYPSLQDALNYCCTKDTVVLPPGLHSLAHFKDLEFGGTVIGIGQRDDIIIQTTNAGDVAMSVDCTSHDFVLLKNLTITIDARKSGILVKSGYLSMEDVVLKGPTVLAVEQGSPSESSPIAWKGLMASAGTRITMNNCRIQNFDVGLRIRQNAVVDVVDTVLDSCNIGVLTEKEASLTFLKSIIAKSNECGVIVEIEGKNDELNISSLENSISDLERISNLKVSKETLNFEGNSRDVKLEYVEAAEGESEDEGN